MYGDIPGGTVAATLEIGLSKYSDHCCQDPLGE
jgi:hypothetical protein